MRLGCIIVRQNVNIKIVHFQEIYTDVTIACEGKFIAAHKLILATCSDYFREVFEKINCLSPVVILKDIKIREFEALINFIYEGEVDVEPNDVAGVIKAAECLQIKGLGVPDDAPLGLTKETVPKKKRPYVKRKKETDESGEPKKARKLNAGTGAKRGRKPRTPVLMKNAKMHAKELSSHSIIGQKESFENPPEKETLGLADMIQADITLTPVKVEKDNDNYVESSIEEPQESNISIELADNFVKPNLENSNTSAKVLHLENKDSLTTESGHNGMLNKNPAEEIIKTVEAAKKKFNEETEALAREGKITNELAEPSASTSQEIEEDKEIVSEKHLFALMYNLYFFKVTDFILLLVYGFIFLKKNKK